MAFPVRQTADDKSGSVTVGSSSWTLTYPTNLQNGDLIIAIMGRPSTTGGAATFPAGFVTANSAGTRATDYAKKVSDGTETGNFTVTLSANNTGGWIVFRITNWGGTLGTTFDNTAGTCGDVARQPSATGTSTTPDPPSLDPASWGTEDTLWIAACMCQAAAGNPSAYPASYSNGINANGLGAAHRQLNAASEDPGTFTQAASVTWIAGTIGVKPITSTTFNQALTATAVVVTASLQRQTNKQMVTTAVAVTASIQRKILKNLTTTAVSLIATVQKQVNKRMTTTAVAATATLQALRVIIKTLTTTPVVTTATLSRRTNKNLSASVTLNASVSKLVSKRLTTTAVAVTATLTRLFPRTLSASVTVNAALTKQTNKNLTATPVVVTATLAKGSVYKKVLSAVVNTTASLLTKFVQLPNLHCTPVGSLSLAATGVGVIGAVCISPGVIGLVCITPSGLTLQCITPGSIPLTKTDIPG